MTTYKLYDPTSGEKPKIGQKYLFKNKDAGNTGDAYDIGEWTGELAYGQSFAKQDEAISNLQSYYNQQKALETSGQSFTGQRSANVLNRINQLTSQIEGLKTTATPISEQYEKFNPNAATLNAEGYSEAYRAKTSAETAVHEAAVKAGTERRVEFPGGGIGYAKILPTYGAETGQGTNQQTTGGKSYKIQSGDTLSALAQRYGTTVQALMSANPQITDANKIYAGANLNIPSSGGSVSTDENGVINGGGKEGVGIANEGKTPEQIAQEQKNEVFKQIQAELDAGQTGSTSAMTGQVTTLPEAPATPNYEQKFTELKASEGYDSLENEIAGYDTEIANLKALTASAVNEEGKRLGPNAIISARKSKITDEQQIELDRLTALKTAAESRMSNKISTINTMMSLYEQDYTTAYNSYTDQYNAAVNANNALSDKQDKASDDARANLQILINNFKDGGVDYSQMSDTQKLSLQTLLMKAGISSEMAESLMQLPIKITATKTNSSGGVDAVGTDSDGNLKVYNLKGISNATTEDQLNYSRIIQGTGDINDLTPSAKTKVENEILKAGFYEDNPPEWFVTQIEQQLQKSFTSSKMKQLWEEYRTPILERIKSTSGSNTTNDLDFNSL